MTFTIKPLEWHGPDFEGEYWAAWIGGKYTIQKPNGNGMWLGGVGGYFQTVEEAKAAAEADYRNRILSTLSLPAQEPLRQVTEIKMTPIADGMPKRDEMRGEQTILTYNDRVGAWDISFMEAGWGDFDAGFALGVTHWLDISEMWPGVTAQVSSFYASTQPEAAITEEMVERIATLYGNSIPGHGWTGFGPTPEQIESALEPSNG